MASVTQIAVGAGANRRPSFWKRAVLDRLRRLPDGELLLADGQEQTHIGSPAADGIRVRLTIHNDRFWRRVALGGSLAAAESYMDGDWDADDLTALVRLFARHLDQADRVDSGLGRAMSPAAWVRHALARNTRGGARRNIAAHYDLGNEFFELMLDPTLTYSCGVFERPDATLEEASTAKIDRLCRALNLSADDHLLEIGTGWGALSIHAATKYGCRVTTTTISRSQYERASERIARAGVDARVKVRLSDYRDLRGTYSKLVAVEMIEAVGAQYYDTFFRTCSDRLAPNGLMALQAITIADQRFAQASREVDFIKRYVFPGSCIPSVTALADASCRSSDFRLVSLDDITANYPRTLAAWRANLSANQAALEALTTERFRRLWQFYLAYCEGGFLERRIGVVHMLFARPEWRG